MSENPYPKSQRYYRVRKILIGGSPIWVILILIVGACLVENFLGARQWQKARKEYLAEGFHLAVENLEQPVRDGNNNLAMSSLIVGATNNPLIMNRLHRMSV